MKKTWILAAVLTVLLAAGGTAYVAAQTGETEARMNQTASSVQNPDCDGTPALDGSGYQGGNQMVSTEESEVTEEPEKATETAEESGESADVICPNPNCPNGGVCVNSDCDGVPAQDGTGNQYGRNNEVGNGAQNRGETCVNSETCPNEDCDGIPAQDGTGNQYGRNDEAGNGVQNRGETCVNSGTCLNEDCDGVPNRDGTGLQKGKNR